MLSYTSRQGRRVDPVLLTPVQVFEYLTTDLKKYMDRNGKGPNFPLPKTTIKVSSAREAA